MIRIFMTGDNHIGLRYASYKQGKKLASKRIEAFQNMVQRANDEKSALFVITGDLFDRGKDIAQKDVRELSELLSTFNGMVFILPGNHDYYGEEVEVWKDVRKTIDTKDNIKLLTENRPYSVSVKDETVILYPAICTSKHSAPDKNNLEWIKNENIVPDDKYHIGIAHGAVEGETIDTEGKYFLMKRNELEQIPMDVWLIGHTHVPFPNNLREDSYLAGERIFNAGTHVQNDDSCDTEGCCFILEIEDADGSKKVQAKKVKSGNLRWYKKEIKVTSGEMRDILERELEEISDDSVVKIVLSGAASQEEYENRNQIVDDVCGRFIEHRCEDDELGKVITNELIEREFSETGFLARMLKSLMNEPKEAQLMYELIKNIKGGQVQ